MVLSLFFPLAGCIKPVSLASYTNVVNLYYAPDRTSPLGRLPPLRIILEVKDRRPVSEEDRVGNGEVRRTDFFQERMFPAKVISQKDAAAILSDAMTDLLHTNGHSVVQLRDPAANVKIEVHLKKFLGYLVENQDIGQILESTFDMDIEMLTGPDNKQILSKPIRSSYRHTYVWYLDFLNCYKDVLNEGLTRFIESFSTDPEVLEALKSVSTHTSPTRSFHQSVDAVSIRDAAKANGLPGDRKQCP